MKVEEILKNIHKYEFKKLDQCFDCPHSSSIGLWSHWWLSLNEKGFIEDGARAVKTPSGSKHPDLMFYDENGKIYGIIEVENSDYAYLLSARNLSYYIKTYDNAKFVILHMRGYVDSNGHFINDEYSKNMKSTIIKIITKYKVLSPYWIVVISKRSKNIKSSDLSFENYVREYVFVGHEWFVFRKGKELKDFYDRVGEGVKFNYARK